MQAIEPYYKALKKSKFKELDILFDGIKTVLTNEQWQEIKKDEDEKQEGGEWVDKLPLSKGGLEMLWINR